MEFYENRVANGVLKAGIADDPERVAELLDVDVEVVVDPGRTASDDLWPCVWALAAVLTRQFSGTVYVRCGRSSPLPGPASLGPRCIFGSSALPPKLRIGVGVAPGGGGIWGDARGASITVGRATQGAEPAHPIACFALAGYLGFAALAEAVGLDTHADDLTTDEIVLAMPPSGDRQAFERDLTFIGLGQLGQAYLALRYFLCGPNAGRIVLVDFDVFERVNWATQILLDHGDQWIGMEKARYIEQRCKEFGWEVAGEVSKLDWCWRRHQRHPALCVLGLDNFDARRMAVEAGFEWLIDAGVGTSFLAPRVSWHSIPPDRQLAKRLFAIGGSRDPVPTEDTLLARRLKQTPGECGWVRFNSVAASAPSLGVTAAAYAWVEIALLSSGTGIEGRACLWSPLLPYERSAIRTPAT